MWPENPPTIQGKSPWGTGVCGGLAPPRGLSSGPESTMTEQSGWPLLEEETGAEVLH